MYLRGPAAGSRCLDQQQWVVEQNVGLTGDAFGSGDVLPAGPSRPARVCVPAAQIAVASLARASHRVHQQAGRGGVGLEAGAAVLGPGSRPIGAGDNQMIIVLVAEQGAASLKPRALGSLVLDQSAGVLVKPEQPRELDELIDAVPDDSLGAVERPLYLAAALTGLRQGELLALKWMDIDWLASRVRVADNFTRGKFDSPKSHEGRSVPMADRLARGLELHSQRSAYRTDDDLVFCHPRPRSHQRSAAG